MLRFVALLAVAAIAVFSGQNAETVVRNAAHVAPTARQLAWQRQDFIAFIHFGPNTYDGREWGTGKESPSIVNPMKFDPDQWMRAFKDAGITKVVLVAKHHDGMVLWPSRYTTQSIKHSRWRNGHGDIVGSFVAAARKYGIGVGFYLSPADIHEALPGGRYANGSKFRPTLIPTLVKGDDRRPKRFFRFSLDDYNRYYLNTLYELLTQYGPVQEVWFDGANPTNRSEPYAFADWYELVRTLQPNAVIFNGPDVNWVGNEDGIARKTQWSVVAFTTTGQPTPDQGKLTDESAANLGGRSDLTNPKTRQLRWYPSECDATIEHHSDPSDNGSVWFWHPADYPRTLAALQTMYYDSVGRNCVLLLDVPPNTQGLLDVRDVARLHELGAWIRNEFGRPLAAANGVAIHAPKPVTFGSVALQERIEDGQRVEQFVVEANVHGAWKQIAQGTTIGYKRLLKLPRPVTASEVRVRVLQSRDTPEVAGVQLYR